MPPRTVGGTPTGAKSGAYGNAPYCVTLVKKIKHA